MNPYHLSKIDYAIKMALSVGIPIAGCALLMAIILGLSMMVSGCWTFFNSF